MELRLDLYFVNFVTMEISYFTETELDYELLIRGVSNEGNKKEKIRCLKELLNQETEIKHGELKNLYYVDVEVDMIAGMMERISEEWESTASENRYELHAKLFHRLKHYSDRIKRCKPENKEQHEILENCKVIGNRLINVWNLNKNDNISCTEESEGAIGGQEALRSDQESQQRHEETPVDIGGSELSKEERFRLGYVTRTSQTPSQININNQQINKNNSVLDDLEDTITKLTNTIIKQQSEIKNLKDMMVSQSRVQQQDNQSSNNFKFDTRNLTQSQNMNLNKPTVNSSTPVLNEFGRISRLLNDTNRLLDVQDNKDGFNVNCIPNYRKPISVPNWNIYFAGDQKEISPRNFINKVEFMADSENIPLNYVVRDIHYLLKTQAHNWYLVNRSGFPDWSTFKQRFLQEYLNRDSDAESMDRIRAFRQGEEGFTEFYAKLELKFRDLEIQPEEPEKIRIIKRGLNKSYRDKLSIIEVSTEIQTLSQLYEIGKKIQQSLYSAISNAGSYQKPFSQEFRRRSEVMEQTVRSQQAEINNIQSEIQSKSSNSSNPRKCFNCQSTEHVFRRCSLPWKKFCFRCGQPDSIASNCTNCRKNQPSDTL